MWFVRKTFVLLCFHMSFLLSTSVIISHVLAPSVSLDWSKLLRIKPITAAIFASVSSSLCVPAASSHHSGVSVHFADLLLAGKLDPDPDQISFLSKESIVDHFLYLFARMETVLLFM